MTAGRVFKIGVMGNAGGNHSKELLDKAAAIGRKIAESGCIFFYGATIGLPFAAAKAAKENGGTVIGVSPGASEREHIEKYHYPVGDADAILFTGFGFQGRNVVLVRSCDAIIIIGGRIGTLSEFCIGYAEQKVVGVLEGSGGIADIAKELEKTMQQEFPTKIIYDSNPERLVEKVFEELRKQKH